MSAYRIARLIHHMRREYYKPCANMSLKRVLHTFTRQKTNRQYATNTTVATPMKTRSYLWRWMLIIPFGVGFSVITILRVKHLMKNDSGEDERVFFRTVDEPLVVLYCMLPLRIASRIWGWIASVQLPVSLRPTLYGFYARTFNANLDEIDLDLSAFPSLVDFFARPLKSDARPICQNTNIVSPSDGKVLHFGPVTSCRVEQVKGSTYNLREFLGDFSLSQTTQSKKFTKEEDETYIKTLLKNPMNQLYQLVVYLAPGDYHRFHSSTDWEIDVRRHFQGRLISVNPRVASCFPNLFSVNERVVYLGKWAGGFMAYTAVGATNVGSIKVYCDEELQTNKIKWPVTKSWKDANLGCARVNKGQLFGEFRMGSTIVLLFEAPKDFEFCLEAGQKIKVGEALTKCVVDSEEKVAEKAKEAL